MRLPSRTRPGKPSPIPHLGLWPAAVLLALIYVLPMLRLVGTSMWMGGQVSLSEYVLLLSSPTFWTILVRTFRIAAIVTTLCVVIGYPLAYTVNRMSPRMTAVVMLIVTLPFFTNLLIWAYAWVAVLGNNGLINHALVALRLITTPVHLVFNEIGVIVGMVQIQLPLMVLPILAVMRRINRPVVLAAQSLGATPAEAFWTVFRPLSAPGVIAGISLVFVTSLGFYITPALLGGPGQYVITQSIDAHVEVRPDFRVAAAEATILLLIVGLLVAALHRSLGLSFRDADDGSEQPARHLRRPIGFGQRLLGKLSSLVPTRLLDSTFQLASATPRSALAVFSAIVTLYLVLPMIVIVPTAFSSAPYLTYPPPGLSMRWFESYLTDADWIGSTWISLLIAILAAILATTAGVFASFPLVRARLRASSLTYVAFLSPIIVPQMVPAVAIFFWLAPIGLTGTIPAFVAVYTVAVLPYVIVVVTASLRRFDVSLERAAASLGAPPARVLTTVTLPLIRPAVVTAFLLAFLIAWNEVVFALFLSGPGVVPLPIRMWENIRMEISPKISAVSVLSLVIAILAITLPALARRDRTGPRAWLPNVDS